MDGKEKRDIVITISFKSLTIIPQHQQGITEVALKKPKLTESSESFEQEVKALK